MKLMTPVSFKSQKKENNDVEYNTKVHTYAHRVTSANEDFTINGVLIYYVFKHERCTLPHYIHIYSHAPRAYYLCSRRFRLNKINGGNIFGRYSWHKNGFMRSPLYTTMAASERKPT